MTPQARNAESRNGLLNAGNPKTVPPNSVRDRTVLLKEPLGRSNMTRPPTTAASYRWVPLRPAWPCQRVPPIRRRGAPTGLRRTRVDAALRSVAAPCPPGLWWLACRATSVGLLAFRRRGTQKGLLSSSKGTRRALEHDEAAARRGVASRLLECGGLVRSSPTRALIA